MEECSNDSKLIVESMNFYYNAGFTERQKQLIESMLNLNCKSIIDLFGENASDEYKTFLINHGITPEKEIIINSFLESHEHLNPNTDKGFEIPKLQKLKKDFYTKNAKLLSMSRLPSSHTITARPRSNITKSRSSINKGKNGGKTKKKKKKNKKKKRKSYKKRKENLIKKEKKIL